MRISLDFCRGALRIDERGAAALLCLDVTSKFQTFWKL